MSYKRGEVIDHTILHQDKNSDKFAKPNVSSDKENQVDNSKIIFHPCLIKPTNIKNSLKILTFTNPFRIWSLTSKKCCIWHKLSNSRSWGRYTLTGCFHYDIITSINLRIHFTYSFHAYTSNFSIYFAFSTQLKDH